MKENNSCVKKLCVFFMAAICVLSASADPITRQQAQQKAAEFLKEINANATLSNTAVSKAPRKVNGRTAGEQAYYFVFNTDNNQGYVIASGDDVAVPVLLVNTTLSEELISQVITANIRSTPTATALLTLRPLMPIRSALILWLTQNWVHSRMCCSHFRRQSHCFS